MCPPNLFAVGFFWDIAVVLASHSLTTESTSALTDRQDRFGFTNPSMAMSKFSTFFFEGGALRDSFPFAIEKEQSQRHQIEIH